MFSGIVQITNLQALFFNSLWALPFHVKIRIVGPRLDFERHPVVDAGGAVVDRPEDVRRLGDVSSRAISKNSRSPPCRP